MPDIIKLLPDSVANQIAAGEVIQRPASLVKELVENSVDADATNIKIIIKDAGRTLVQVIDNGTGMTETDARLSFERHATSKIDKAEDLFSIHTKGFRGEALASIAAVAMVELRTRKKGNELGSILKISGSKVETQEPDNCPEGTNIAVKNLFYNVPARRKFLKSDKTELRHLINEFQRVALAHPDINFTLTSNDKDLFNLLPGNLRQRIVGVFGKSINAGLIDIGTETSLVEIKGYIGKPETARKTYGEQYFFVNNRYMRHPYFHKAIMEAYENILPPDSIPSYFLFLNTDPAAIDVNIHPTKTEIKFENERMLWQIIHAAVREGLGKFNIAPSLDFDNEGIIDIPVASTGHVDMPEIKVNPDFNPFNDEDSYQRDKISFDRSGKPDRSNLGNWEKLYTDFNQGTEPAPPVESSETPEAHIRQILQLKNKYIVCPVKSGLMLIDQKRAHERVLFEKFLGALRDNSCISQLTLFPKTIELSQGDMAILTEIEDDLLNCGFEIQYLGKSAISINAYPADSKNDDPYEMLEILLEGYRSKEKLPGDDRKEKLAAAMARAAAIPYGRTLQNAEISELFDSLFMTTNPNYSPHGKPVVSIITIEELEKRLR